MLQTKSLINRALCSACMALIGWGCTSAATDIDTSFDMPTGVAVAGTTAQRLFVANTGEDALQVLELGDDLTSIDPVEGPSFYFPLRIPGGPAPEEITATEDGRFVVILNWVTSNLHLVDADTLDNARASGAEVEVDLGDLLNPYRIEALPGACATSAVENCSAHLVISYPEEGVITEWIVQDNPDGPSISAGSTFTVDGSPGEMTAAPNGQFLFAADTQAPHVHRIDLGTGAVEKWEIGHEAATLSVSTGGRYLVVGRKGIKDALILEGATGESATTLNSNAYLTPGTRCLANCDSTEILEQCPGAHPADTALCLGENGIEASPDGDYKGLYLGYIPAAITALGAGAGHPAISVPCQSIADEPLEQIWSEVVMIQGQNGQGSFVGLALESGEDTVPTLLSEGWCRGSSINDSAEEAYLTALEDPSTEAVEPLYFDDVFSPCSELPDLNRFDCVTIDEGEAGVVLSPARTRTSFLSYEWEPVVTLPTTGEAFRRPITGGIYKVENEVALFADAGISIGTFAPHFRTRKQLIEQGICTEETENCGDILEITSELNSAVPAAIPGEAAGTTPVITEECLAALSEEPADRCSLERRIIDTRSIDNSTELILDRPLPEACLPESGRITYQVRMGDVYGLRPTGGSTERLGPGDGIGLGGSVWPTGAIQATIKPSDVDVRASNACERYGVDGSFIGTRYQRDTSGAVTISDKHSETLSNGNTVGLTWTLLQTTSGEAMSAAGAPMLLGSSVLWETQGSLPVIFTSYARSNRIVGLVPYPYTADPDDEFDADAPFLSNSWRDAPTHFTELN